MIFYRQRKIMLRYFRYLRLLIKSAFIPVKKRAVFFDTSHIAINRYLYSFLKMFQLMGYSVFIPLDSKTANTLSNTRGEFRYASRLISEKVIKFGKPPAEAIKFTKDKMSIAYFNEDQKGYRVPVCCYPWFYKNYKRFGELELNGDRKNSVFMSGNIDPKFYDRLSDAEIFSQLPSRKKTADFLRKSSYFYPVTNNGKLDAFIKDTLDSKVIIIDSSSDFRIDLEALPSLLQEFTFYLALPGILVPQSHNLTEAMLFGCIPVLHKEYAQLLDPPLESFKNAIVFNSLEELEALLPKIFELKAVQINQMRQQVREYYNIYLSPKAVTEKVLQSRGTIFIQAEQISLNKLKA